jgi:hypothetical protein
MAFNPRLSNVTAIGASGGSHDIAVDHRLGSTVTGSSSGNNAMPFDPRLSNVTAIGASSGSNAMAVDGHIGGAVTDVLRSSNDMAIDPRVGNTVMAIDHRVGGVVTDASSGSSAMAVDSGVTGTTTDPSRGSNVTAVDHRVAGAVTDVSRGSNALAVLAGAAIDVSRGISAMAIDHLVTGAATDVSRGGNAMAIDHLVAGAATDVSRGSDAMAVDPHLAGAAIDISRGSSALAVDHRIAGAVTDVSRGSNALAVLAGAAIGISRGGNAMAVDHLVTGAVTDVSRGSSALAVDHRVAGTATDVSHGSNAMAIDHLVTGAATDVSRSSSAMAINHLATGAATDVSRGSNVMAIDHLVTGAATDASRGSNVMAIDHLVTGAATDVSRSSNAMAVNPRLSHVITGSPSSGNTTAVDPRLAGAATDISRGGYVMAVDPRLGHVTIGTPSSGNATAINPMLINSIPGVSRGSNVMAVDPMIINTVPDTSHGSNTTTSHPQLINPTMINNNTIIPIIPRPGTSNSRSSNAVVVGLRVVNTITGDSTSTTIHPRFMNNSMTSNSSSSTSNTNAGIAEAGSSTSINSQQNNTSDNKTKNVNVWFWEKAAYFCLVNDGCKASYDVDLLINIRQDPHAHRSSMGPWVGDRDPCAYFHQLMSWYGLRHWQLAIRASPDERKLDDRTLLGATLNEFIIWCGGNAIHLYTKGIKAILRLNNCLYADFFDLKEDISNQSRFSNWLEFLAVQYWLQYRYESLVTRLSADYWEACSYLSKSNALKDDEHPSNILDHQFQKRLQDDIDLASKELDTVTSSGDFNMIIKAKEKQRIILLKKTMISIFEISTREYRLYQRKHEQHKVRAEWIKSQLQFIKSEEFTPVRMTMEEFKASKSLCDYLRKCITIKDFNKAYDDEYQAAYANYHDGRSRDRVSMDHLIIEDGPIPISNICDHNWICKSQDRHGGSSMDNPYFVSHYPGYSSKTVVRILRDEVGKQSRGIQSQQSTEESSSSSTSSLVSSSTHPKGKGKAKDYDQSRDILKTRPREEAMAKVTKRYKSS